MSERKENKMDAKEFLTIYSQECQSHDDCNGCPFDKKGGCQLDFVADEEGCIDRLIDIAEKLNHKKTYADDFFEKFPNAQKEANGVPRSCRDLVYGTKSAYCTGGGCHRCWNEPMPEEEK